MDGTAAKEGEKEKLKRYPPREGLTMHPAAIESYGRFGPALLLLLGGLQSHVSLMSGLTGLSAKRCRNRWFVLLGTALVRGVSHAIIFSTERAERSHGGDSGGLQGRSRRGTIQ